MPPRTCRSVLALAALIAVVAAPRAAAQSTSRVSVTGLNANGESTDSFAPAVSANGRYVAFVSGASNLVPGDNNGRDDIFVTDTATGQTTRVSVSSDGAEGNGDSAGPAISADGRYVAFNSLASNLVANDTPDTEDVFLHDTQTGETRRISRTSSGDTPNGDSDSLDISADGRYIVFDSLASNLVSGDTNNSWDVFLHDTQTGATERVSVSNTEAQGNDDSVFPSVSADGRYVVFASYATNMVTGDTNVHEDVFLRDRQAGTTVRVSVGTSGQGNDDSERASVSADGRYVAFDSLASNLVSGDTNTSWDVFLRDVKNGTTSRVSVTTSGTQGNGESGFPVITPDARFVAFESAASNLVAADTNESSDVFLRDISGQVTTRLSLADDGTEGNGDSYLPGLSADGSTAAFYSASTDLAVNDTNALDDVFLRGLTAGLTRRLTELKQPGEANGASGAGGIAVSGDARYTAFASAASNLVPDDTNNAPDIFMHDGATGDTWRVSISTGADPANAESRAPSISDDGQFVAFASRADNLVLGDTNSKADIFLHDNQTGETRRVSVASDGTQSNGDSESPALSAGGEFVAFTSSGSNLVSGDTNGRSDVFLYEAATGVARRVSVGPGGAQANGDSRDASISADGRFVAFTSDASNLVEGDTNGVSDVFLRDVTTGETVRVSLGPNGEQANGASSSPAVSADGQFVAFASLASNLGAAGPKDAAAVYWRDVAAGETRPVSVSSQNAPANAASVAPSISASGRRVGFVSPASNLAPGDTNSAWDAFVHDMETGSTQRVSISTSMGQGEADTNAAVISGSGEYMAFVSLAATLIFGDTNHAMDVFLRGPIPTITPPATAEAALRAAGGLAATAGDFTRLDVNQSGAVDIRDAVTLARKATGLAP